MNSKERILAALEHKKTDKVPIHHTSISSKAASEILGREVYVGGGSQQFREANARFLGEEEHKKFLEKSFIDAMEVTKAFDQDLVRLFYWREGKKPVKKIDENTFKFEEHEGSYRIKRYFPEAELYQVVESSVKEESKDFDYLEKVVKEMEEEFKSREWKEENYSAYKKADKYFNGEKAVYGAGAGLGVPYDPAVWFEATIVRPDLVKRFLDVEVESALKAIEIFSKINVKLLRGGGDAASAQGPFYSPETFRELVLPPLKKISDFCHEKGIFYGFSSDGNLWPVADIIFKEPKLDAYFEVDRIAGMDLKMLREKLPHLTLFGNISSITLHQGTKEDVYRETIDCLETAKKLGSIVVGISNAIMPETPTENVEMMLKTIRKYNK